MTFGKSSRWRRTLVAAKCPRTAEFYVRVNEQVDTETRDDRITNNMTIVVFQIQSVNSTSNGGRSYVSVGERGKRVAKEFWWEFFVGWGAAILRLREKGKHKETLAAGGDFACSKVACSCPGGG